MSLSAEAGKILRIAFPLIVANAAHMGMGVTDTIMAGHFGTVDLAAIAIGTSLWVLGHLFVYGLLAATSPLMSHRYGSRDYLGIGSVFRQSIWLAIIAAFPLWFVTRASGLLMPAIGIEPEIIAVTQPYLNAVSWGMMGNCLLLAMRFLGEGVDYTRPVMVAQVSGLLLNIVCNTIFMYGKLGFPAMGAVGAGVSTAIVMWFVAACLFLYTLLHRHYRPFDLFKGFEWPRWHILWEILRLGMPISLMWLMEVGMFSTAALLMGKLGASATAAHQVAINYAALMFMIPLGFSRAGAVRVGQSLGAGDVATARLSGYLTMGMSALVMSLSAIFMLLLPEVIIGIYTKEEEVISVALELIFMAALFQVFDGIQVSANGALQGMKDTTVPMFITLVVYWMVGLPVSYVFGFTNGLGAKGIWAGLVAGLVLAALLLGIRFVRLMHSRE